MSSFMIILVPNGLEVHVAVAALVGSLSSVNPEMHQHIAFLCKSPFAVRECTFVFILAVVHRSSMYIQA